MGKTAMVAVGSGPGSCEDTMGMAEGAAGGIYLAKGPFTANVVVSGNLYTGQNPPS